MTDKKIDQYFAHITPRRSKRQRSSSSPDLTVSPINKQMDEDKVGNLTQHQLMAGLSSLLDQKLANLATKEDLAYLNKKVEDLQLENNNLKDEIASLKRQENVVMDRLVDLESRSRRNNLIFKGLQIPQKTVDYCYVVKKFCCEVLGCEDNLYVNRAHPLGQDRSTIIAHMPNDQDVNYVMSRTRTLKNTGYVVHRDYPIEIRERRAKLAKLREEVERVSGRRKMPLIYDSLVIDGCRFTWREKLMLGAYDGGMRLQEMLGYDFSNFLAKLKLNNIGDRRNRDRHSASRDTAAKRRNGDQQAEPEETAANKRDGDRPPTTGDGAADRRSDRGGPRAGSSYGSTQ